MVIVTATRVDLRHESVMADEAFALSPISARALQPSEADYDAIREAFMETSRGRWFLGEYAKRNRNADTSMVMDAVARIEESLSAHRQAPSPDERLSEALATIKSAMDQAIQTASAAFDAAALEANLAPIRKGTRIIKEISWRWREIGADGRICDLIDSQLDAIEAGCGQITQIDPRAALNEALDLIKTSIDGFADSDTAPPAAEDAVATASAPASNRMAQPNEAGDAIGTEVALAESEEPAPEASAAHHAEVALAEEASDPENSIQESLIQESLSRESLSRENLAQDASVQDSSVRETLADALAPTEALIEQSAVVEEAHLTPANEAAEAVDPAERETVDAEAAVHDDAHDAAVLELIAAEMAEPDPIGCDDDSGPVDEDIVVTRRPEAVSIERMPEPVAPVRPPVVHPFPQPSSPISFQPTATAARETPPTPANEPSLGSTIIAGGFLPPTKTPANDPLAPIRRMSQAEKIAFFS
jgi:chemotaxis protein histidine kinase CheA